MSNIVDIINYNCYLTKMSKTFFDKAWFVSHLPEDICTIVDVGCADGSFMEFLKRSGLDFEYIGIDNDPEMQRLTKEKGFTCYSSIKEFKESGCIFEENMCVVLNSVVHELYSYFNESVLSDIYALHPKYIAIRDMMYNPIDRTRFYLPIDDYEKIINVFKEKYPEQYEQFYKFHHHQNYEKQIAHFLLKYMYTENWDREVKEDYLSYDINQIRNYFCENFIFPDSNYHIEFQTFYKLPYLVNKWKKDFDLKNNHELNEYIRNINTHYKMLLKYGE